MNTIILPYQLFQDLSIWNKNSTLYLIEEYHLFNLYSFHKLKLVLHRASMKAYQDLLKSHDFKVIYLSCTEEVSRIEKLMENFKNQSLEMLDPCDNWIEKKLIQSAEKFNVSLKIMDSPLFINSKEELKMTPHRKNFYFQTDFYTLQRKKLSILMEDGKPKEGKWTFDTENRSKYPKTEIPPSFLPSEENSYIQEARTYVEELFPDNPGNSKGPILFEINKEGTQKRILEFLENRFLHFGKYEDAILKEEHVLNHSVLSPMINIGLIHPLDLVLKAEEFAEKKNIPINSSEGFIRQIIGWREFIRWVYLEKGTYQRTKNYWNFHRKIPDSFWKGTTGIAPVDITIKKILETGYCHHIERLMVLGNFMVLCEFDPDEVYRWFMEMFIDAYDWVMVPNVYGMTQFADGGTMTTKPYISGSNYLMKMSNYPKGEWQKTWDGLYWRFIDKQRNFFLKNPRMGMMVNLFNKMPEEKRKEHLNHAEKFLANLS